MTLNISEILSFAAILISGLSAYYARGQRDLAHTANETIYRAQLAERHEKYRVALKRENEVHKEELRALSSSATAALRKVIDIFDDFDIEEARPRYLRHILHESSEMVYYAFKGQLGWQSGANISGRIYQFVWIENNLEPCRRYFDQDFSREAWAQAYFKGENSYLEQFLLKDKYFCGLIQELNRRLDPSDGPELLRQVLGAIENFVVLLKRAQPGIYKSSELLGEMLEESEQEHFPLRKSPDLFNRLNYGKSTLEIMSCLLIPSIRPEDVDKYKNFVSISVYLCAVLHAVEGFYSWGWAEYQRI